MIHTPTSEERKPAREFEDWKWFEDPYPRKMPRQRVLISEARTNPDDTPGDITQTVRPGSSSRMQLFGRYYE